MLIVCEKECDGLWAVDWEAPDGRPVESVAVCDWLKLRFRIPVEIGRIS